MRVFIFTPLALLVIYLGMRFLPYPALERFLDGPYSVRVYDRAGALVQITPLEDGLRREFIPLDMMPPALVQVFLIAEDERFYAHPGIDPLAAGRAALQNAAGGRRVSGASTITMQLARLIAERSGGRRGGALARKAGEAFNALRLECRLPKRRILELYLNNVPFGFQTEGAASAARNFFAAELDMLSPPQIFALAVVPRRPARYNPLEEDGEAWPAARALQGRFAASPALANKWPLLAGMNDADWRQAAAGARRFAYPFEMPHLVRYLTTPRSGGSAIPLPFELRLTADLALSQFIEGLIRMNVERYAAQRLSNGAAVVLDNASGAVLAWVGSADFGNAAAAGQIDGVLARNQPGSSMKPFLYALALEQGVAPPSVFADVPSRYGTEALYIPQNFNNRFNGPVLMREALASSLNIPAVELLYRLGQRNYVDFLRVLGFASLEDDAPAEDAGLGLALGNAPVSLVELARAFSVFPNDGFLAPLVFEASSPDAAGPLAVLAPDTARIICAFLSDADARVLAFGRPKNFRTQYPAIFKTGTANQYQSITALAASRRFTVAVWMGNFSGETVIGKTGSSVPAAIARDTLDFLQGRAAGGVLDFAAPEDFVLTPVCAVSGKKPAPACLASVREFVRRGTELAPCDWHFFEDGAAQVRYPAEYQSWFLSSKRSGTLDYAGAPLTVLAPRDGYLYYTNPADGGRGVIPVEVTGGQADTLDVEFDGSLIRVERPFIFELPARPGRHTLIVRCGSEEAAVSFLID